MDLKPIFLVTGGGGFIGTWVIRELLRRECSVVAYDLAEGGSRWKEILGASAKAVQFIRGDLLETQALAEVLDRRAISHIIHLGAWLTPACQRDPMRGCQINVLGTLGIFDLIRARKGQIQGFSYASSVAVYGSELDDAPGAPQTAPFDPQTFYGVFKRTTEMIAQQYWLHFGIPSVGLRPYVVYGPGRELGLTAGPTLAARAAAQGESYTFCFSGAAGFEYVEDTARAFVQAALGRPTTHGLSICPASTAPWTTWSEFCPRSDQPLFPGSPSRDLRYRARSLRALPQFAVYSRSGRLRR